MRRLLVALLLLAAPIAGATSALAEKRLALVIGNDAYQQVPPLSKAATDANAIASALRKLDFTVTVAENQSRAALSQSLLSFGTTIGPGDTVFFFFAGHGFEIRGRNYLLPTDVPAATEGQEDLVRDASFEVERIIDRLQERGARTMIVVLDACRNNPFARPGTRAVGGEGGLAPITPPEGTFILFSAGAKQTALDSMSQSDPDPNSVFTRNFVRELAQPKLTLVQLAKRTQAQVRGLASSIKHEQTPAYYDEIVGDFVLNTREGTASEPQIAALNVPRPEPNPPPEASSKGGGAKNGPPRAFNVPRPEAIAPRPEPPPAPSQPVNAPLATFMRNSGGWSVTMSFLDPVTAISWRLGNDGPFKETGALDALDPRTRRRMANPTFELEKDQATATIQVRAIDANGNVAGPFPISFDPDAELARGDRRILEMTASDWVSFRQYNGLLLYYTQLISFRCAIREVRIGIDNTRPDKAIPMPPCDPLHYAEIPNDAKGYMNLPPTTQAVTVELTYRDGSVSETKTFKKSST